MPRVQVRGVSKHFGRIVALEKVDLDIQDREYLVILGPSGCGKTTLIKIIAGIWQPTEGRIIVDNSDVTETPLETRDLGYVFQNIVLFPHMNVRDNAGYGPRVRGLTKDETQEATQEAMNLVGVLRHQGLFPQELSGGAQQKAALARALSNRPRLLLLDEPLSALDARVRVELRYTLRRLVKDLGLTAIHVTHDQEEAMSVADRVVLMRKGSIVEVGEPQMMYDNPQHLFTANFVGESNFLEGVVHHVDDGLATVELREQQLLRLRRSSVRPGQPIVVATRPEYLLIKDESGPNCIQGSVKEARFMGSYLRYKLELTNGEEVVADRVLREPTLDIGDTVFVSFSPETSLLYPRPFDGLAEVLRLD